MGEVRVDGPPVDAGPSHCLTASPSQRFGTGKARRRSFDQSFLLGLKHRTGLPAVGMAAVFVVLLLILSAVGQAPPPGHYYPQVTSPTGVVRSAPVGTPETFYLNFTGGEVSTSQVADYYHLYWFWGQANATGNISVYEQAVLPPSTCTITTNCTATTSLTISHKWNVTGSYDVSVTIYDGQFDYTIYSFVVNVYVPKIDVILPCFGTAGMKTNAAEGGVVEYWAQGIYDSNRTDVNGLTYLFDWGDGTSTYGAVGYYCYQGPGMFAQHIWNDSGSYIVTVTAYNRLNGFDARVYWEVNVTNPHPTIPTNTYTSVPIAAVAPSGTVGDPTPAYACVIDTPADLPKLSVLWNWGDGPDQATPVVNASNATPCIYGYLGSYTTYPGTLNITTSHTYARSGTYHYTIRVEDEEGAIYNGTPTPNTVAVTTTATANTTHALSRTIGSAVILDAANLTSLATPAPGFNYTWVSGHGAKSWGPQAPVAAFAPGTQTARLYINNTTTGAAIVSNSQAISWSTPPPSAGLLQAAFNYTGPILFQLTSGQGQFNAIVLQATCDGAPCATSTLSPPQVQANLLVPTVMLLSHSEMLTLQFTGSPNFPNAVVNGNIIFAFTGNSSHPLVIPVSFVANAPPTWFFQLDLEHAARGQPVVLTTQVFSATSDSLTTTWAWGDGTTAGSYTSAAGTGTAPTEYNVYETHTWKANAAYSLGVTVSDGTLTQSRAYQISESSEPAVNDTAPTATLSASTVFEDAPTTFTIHASEQNPRELAGKVSWTFGDGGSGVNSTAIYRFHYGGKFVTAAYVYSHNGTSSVEWAWTTVKEPMPVAGFRVGPATVSVDVPVVVNASVSAADSYGAYELTYFWNWGDGITSGGGSWAGMGSVHVYATSGTRTLALTVIDNEGRMATSSHVVTVNPLSLTASLPSTFTVTAGEVTHLAPTFSSLPPSGQPFVNATWTWNDSTANPIGSAWDTYHWGVVSSHVFAVPGSYKVSVVLQDLHGGSPVHLSTTVKAIDPAPMVLAEYSDGVDYGMNHSAPFTQTVLGSWADQNLPNTTWTFTWQWGDGGGNTVQHPNAASSTAAHLYLNQLPSVNLVVSILTPFGSAYRSAGSSSSQLFLVSDWDGDGLPNQYETTISHTHPGCDSTAGPPSCEGGTGYGFTDFLSQQLGVGNPSTDVDGDGLTTMQELTGSVTGFVSNPLDPNTAGDGIGDGAHFFTDNFPATTVAPIGSGGGAVTLYFPNVTYSGSGPAFNSSELSIEFDTAAASQLQNYTTLTVVGPNGVTYGTVYAQSSNVNKFYLVNSTPFGGSSSGFGITPSAFTQLGTWTVQVSVSGGLGASVSIASADISVAYYTNPSIADPTLQGMLEGNLVTTPLYNCSAPPTEYYPAYNPATISFTHVTYWPYTETYYKLSVVQGVPYVKGTDPTIGQQNVQSGLCPSNFDLNGAGDTATYLGDADFGISPLNAHASGDSSLTNGMKALGATNYTLTAGLYESWSQGDSMVSALSNPGYPSDPLAGRGGDFVLPLNPTAYSTAGTGIADSVAPDPLHALGLAITISSATDPTCFPTILTPQYVASVTLTSSTVSPRPIIYTPDVSGGGGSGCGFLNLGSTGFTATFNDYYFLPVDNTQSTWSVEFDLWQNQTMTAEGAHVTVDLSGSMSSQSPVSTPSGSGITATAQLLPMQREPLIFENTTGELQNIPGYGYRFVGPVGGFEAFYVNMGTQYTPPSPFVAGVNVILESQAAYALSAFNQSMVTNPSKTQIPASLSCLSSALVTTRSSGPTPPGINQTWSINLTTQSAQSCGSTLLTALLAENLTGVVVGNYEALGTDAIERLGVAPGVLYVDPYTPPAGYASAMGTPPTNWVQQFTTAVESALTALAGAIVAFANFMAQLVTLLIKAIAQALVGAFNAAVAAVTAIADDIASLFSWILSALATVFEALANLMEKALVNAFTSLGVGQATDDLSYLTDKGLITSTEYSSDIGAFGGGILAPRRTASVGPRPLASVHPRSSPIGLSQIQSDWNGYDTVALAIIGAIIVGVAAANIATAVMSGGAKPAVEALLFKVIDVNVKNELRSAIQSTMTIVAGALTSSLLDSVLSGSSSSVKGAMGVLGFLTNGAALIASAIQVLLDFGPWQVVQSIPKVAGAFAIAMFLDIVALTLGGMSYTIYVKTGGSSDGGFILAILGLLVGVVSLTFQATASFIGWGVALFPLGLLGTVGALVGIGNSLYNALKDDQTIK